MSGERLERDPFAKGPSKPLWTETTRRSPLLSPGYEQTTRFDPRTGETTTDTDFGGSHVYREHPDGSGERLNK